MENNQILHLNIEDNCKTIHINGAENRVIRIDFTDDAVAIRTRKAIAALQQITEKYEKLTEPDEDSEDIDAIIAFIDEEEKAFNEIREWINYIFDDDNTSNAVFGNKSPLALAKGGKQTVLEVFINFVVSQIEAEQNVKIEAFKKSQQRIRKYTNKYPKGVR